MIIGPDFSRLATEENFEEIDALLRAAFKGPSEAELVQRLRSDCDMMFEMVKPWNGVIGAYAAVSRMRKPDGWACLGPVAVLPEYQNGALAPDISQKHFYSFGTRLVKELVQIALLGPQTTEQMPQTPAAIVVLGEPEFYRRAGFSSERARALKTPYPVDYTLIAKSGDDVPEEELIYPAAFAEL